MKNCPTVTIVCPVSNRLEVVCEAIDSVLGQSFDCWELIIIDDDSSDGAAEFCQKVAENNENVIFKSRPVDAPSGAQWARNYGLNVAKGEFIIFFDSDDVLERNCVANRVAAMRCAKDLDFIAYTGRIFAEVPGDREFLWNAPNSFSIRSRFLSGEPAWQTAGPIWRTKCIMGTLSWDERLPIFQDQDFHSMAILKGLSGEYRDQVDHHVRVAPTHHSISGEWYSSATIHALLLSAEKRFHAAFKVGQLSEGDKQALRAAVLMIFKFIIHLQEKSGCPAEGSMRRLQNLCKQYSLYSSVESRLLFGYRPDQIALTTLLRELLTTIVLSGTLRRLHSRWPTKSVSIESLQNPACYAKSQLRKEQLSPIFSLDAVQKYVFGQTLFLLVRGHFRKALKYFYSRSKRTLLFCFRKLTSVVL